MVEKGKDTKMKSSVYLMVLKLIKTKEVRNR